MCLKTLISNSVQFASTLAHCSDHVLQVKKQNDSTTSLKKWHRRVFQTMYDSRHWYYSCCFSPQNNFHPTPWWVLNSVVDTIVPVQSNERRSRNWNSRAGQSFHLIMKLWTSIHIMHNLQLDYEFFWVISQITLRNQFWIDHIWAQTYSLSNKQQSFSCARCHFVMASSNNQSDDPAFDQSSWLDYPTIPFLARVSYHEQLFFVD